MDYCAIASGSNGNCYYVGTKEEGVLVDVGLNSKHIHQRMYNLDLDPAQLRAIFITHEHTDHVRGLSVFAKKYDLPVYLTKGSYIGTRLQLPSHLVHYIAADAVVEIGGLSVRALPKYHDAKEPCSFMISDGITNVGILTDIGRACSNVKAAIQESDVLFLESNYDEEMLWNGRYSYFLKNRIAGGWGHLSNGKALELFLECRSSRLRHLILGHLSGANNTVDKVMETFRPYCPELSLSVATRQQETALFSIKSLPHKTIPFRPQLEQLTLDFGA